jgi:hypothetical protein
MLAIGFLYWLAFLLSLEPGNISRALRAGAGLQWPRETIRILGASLLGCAATPVPLAMVRHFPVAGAQWRRRLVFQCIGGLALAAALIMASCVLAEAFLDAPSRPLATAVREEMVANGPLVAFCIAGFIGLAHALRSARPLAGDSGRYAAPDVRAYLTALPVRERGRVTMIDVSDIDWIETQGNYLALHAATGTHLIRETLAKLETRLDPARFRRVHRRTLVAADRIASIDSLGGGDARLRLKDGTELRLSRTYRSRLPALLCREDVGPHEA